MRETSLPASRRQMASAGVRWHDSVYHRLTERNAPSERFHVEERLNNRGRLFRENKHSVRHTKCCIQVSTIHDTPTQRGKQATAEHGNPMTAAFLTVCQIKHVVLTQQASALCQLMESVGIVFPSLEKCDSDI